jgi:hypothetical protein
VADAILDAYANSNPSASNPYTPVQFLIGVIGFVTGIIAEVALLRVVVFGDRKPGLYVYLWLGGGELRLIAVTILLGIATAAAAVAAGLVFGILAAITLPVFAVVALLGFIGCVVAAIWAMLRLSLIAPIVVAENTLGVEQSWNVTRGQALHLLGVILLTYVPVMVLSLLVYVAIIGSDFPPLPSFPDWTASGGKAASLSKEAWEAFGKDIERFQVGLLKATRAHWTAVNALSFVGNVISTALWAGAVGSAYTARLGDKLHETVR